MCICDVPPLNRTSFVQVFVQPVLVVSVWSKTWPHSSVWILQPDFSGAKPTCIVLWLDLTNGNRVLLRREGVVVDHTHGSRYGFHCVLLLCMNIENKWSVVRVQADDCSRAFVGHSLVLYWESWYSCRLYNRSSVQVRTVLIFCAFHFHWCSGAAHCLIRLVNQP